MVELLKRRIPCYWCRSRDWEVLRECCADHKRLCCADCWDSDAGMEHAASARRGHGQITKIDEGPLFFTILCECGWMEPGRKDQKEAAERRMYEHIITGDRPEPVLVDAMTGQRIPRAEVRAAAKRGRFAVGR